MHRAKLTGGTSRFDPYTASSKASEPSRRLPHMTTSRRSSRTSRSSAHGQERVLVEVSSCLQKKVQCTQKSTNPKVTRRCEHEPKPEVTLPIPAHSFALLLSYCPPNIINTCREEKQNKTNDSPRGSLAALSTTAWRRTPTCP